jgi:hypothetical protein
MTSLRSALLAGLILAGFVPVTVALAEAPVQWYTDTGGGGTLAQPPGESKSGGAVAPISTESPVEDPPDSDISATEPVSSPPPSATQPHDWSEGQALAAGAHPVARAAQDAPTVTGGDDQESTAAGPIAALPLTGLQLAAVAAAGLLLLTAGALLRPRRRHAAPG